MRVYSHVLVCAGWKTARVVCNTTTAKQEITFRKSTNIQRGDAASTSNLFPPPPALTNARFFKFDISQYLRSLNPPFTMVTFNLVVSLSKQQPVCTLSLRASYD